MTDPIGGDPTRTPRSARLGSGGVLIPTPRIPIRCLWIPIRLTFPAIAVPRSASAA